MNIKFYALHVIAMVLLSTFTIKAQTVDTLSMGPEYANDIFYSMENGVVSTVERSNWDIAFYTPKFSAGVMVNEGMEIKLYTYPNGDTSDWASIDTTNMSTWLPIYNSPEIWEDGAFNRNATGHPDYGWGWYNMADHHLYGDSLYILDIPGEGKKKLWIMEKKSIDNIYIFKYADLGGTKENEVELDVSQYEDRRFIYYSLVNEEVVNREPESDTWDILFTRYYEEIEDGEGNVVNYPVNGATTNIDIGANNFRPVAPDYSDWSYEPFDSMKNTIGHDWKFFDFSTGWIVLDSNVYFVQNYKGDVYKLVFTWWDGMSSGDFALEKELVSLVSVDEVSVAADEFIVFPNPASDHFTVRGDFDFKGEAGISVIDQSGRIVYREERSADDLRGGVQIGNIDLPQGLYIISIRGNDISSTQKLMIR
jgi:hypothetical protein